MAVDVLPAYHGLYEVTTDAGNVTLQTFGEDAWEGDRPIRSWRGIDVSLKPQERKKLKASLAVHDASPAYKEDAANAALMLARNLVSKKGKRITISLYYQLALGMGARLNEADVVHLGRATRKLGARQRQKIEEKMAELRVAPRAPL